MAKTSVFDPKIGDRVLTPDGEIITVRGVLKVTGGYDASKCLPAPKGEAPTFTKDKNAAADAIDVVIWGD